MPSYAVAIAIGSTLPIYTFCHQITNAPKDMLHEAIWF
jgi:hypothetical protein